MNTTVKALVSSVVAVLLVSVLALLAVTARQSQALSDARNAASEDAQVISQLSWQIDTAETAETVIGYSPSEDSPVTFVPGTVDYSNGTWYAR